ncbi:hypothetical protein PIB30_093182, partial [Stylosanthes scabra]|nr:hypothetical protein [Stylosanthes scabra]
MGFASKKWKQGKKKCGNSNKRHGKHNINSNKSHMGKLRAAHEEQKTKMGQINQILVNHALDSQAGNMYTHWALQQANQNLVPMRPTKIPPAIRENFR